MNIPVWTPKHPENSRMWDFMHYVHERYSISLPNYFALYQWSINKPAQFWETIAHYFKVSFNTGPEQILNQHQSMLDAQWFSGATFNFAEQLLKRKDNHPALISVNEEGLRTVLSYEQLNKQVASCIQGLKKIGIGIGDRVAAVMPNRAETIIAMLASSALGAIWSSCSPDFGSQAIIDRLSQINPSVLFICDGHQYMGRKYEASNKILEINGAIASLKTIVVYPEIQSHIIPNLPKVQYWDDFLKPSLECTFLPLPFDHPLYILFSSGTTGKPKCIMHGAGGTLLQHLKELGLHTDIKNTDNHCFYTTCGWMMWNWMVSTLALGATITLYEGAPIYPDSYRLFEVLEQEKVTIFGTSAKFISTLEKGKAYPNQRFSLQKLRSILSTGSPLLPNNYDFVYEHISPSVQLSSISGGTDIISCFALGNPLLPVYKGELQCLGLGMTVEVFNEQGQSVQQQRGELVCTQAFPSMPIGFWQDPNKKAYHQAYFERFKDIWAHGDFAEITAHQGLIIYGRSDTVLNPGGVRIGTAEIYRQVEKIDEIVDCIVIGQDWENDIRIILFVKLRPSLTLNEALEKKIRQTIRTQASPRHVPAKILQVSDIPRTINGKIVELAVKQIVQGLPVNNLGSIANPEALRDFKERKELG
jgi:acetoacetyl-CoA synthetase